MTPADQSPESPKKGDPSASPPNPDTNGQNAEDTKESGIWPFDGPRPYKLSAEELEWLREHWAKEDEEQSPPICAICSKTADFNWQISSQN
jgi:hypothetical protein